MVSVDSDLYNNEGIPIRHIKKKVLVLGEGGVGKTTLLYRYINKVFLDSTKMTIGSDFFVKKIKHSDENFENRLTLLLWDFAGQERFRFILKDYTRGAEGVLLAFDLTRFASLQKLYNWIEILDEGKVWNVPEVKYFLVGTKADLADQNPGARVSQEVIDEFCENFQISQYYETSALNGSGVESLFRNVAIELITQEDTKSQN